MEAKMKAAMTVTTSKRQLRAQARAWWRSGMIGFVALGVLGAWSPPARAQDVSTYTRQTFIDWFNKYKDAKPDFKVGDVLTAKDLDRIRPFMFPGYLEQLNFPEFKMPIMAYADHTPRKEYLECTEKYQGQVRLAANKSLENYVCGQAFPNSSITAGDPDSGWKAAWNFEYRWQNFGLFTVPPVTWERFGGTHDIPDWESPPKEWSAGIPYPGTMPSADELKLMYGGGGTFQRTLNAFYERVYFTHLAQVPDHTLPTPGAKDFEFKEFTGFYTPFDIRGTAFIVYRYADPTREDDGWAYLPALRRVRRISAEVKSDSLLGTDHTIEDFYGFSGRELEWKWNFIGWKDVLAVQDSQHDYTYMYGPNGIIPNDSWSLRHFALMERIPTSTRHPYSSVLLLWDTQNWDTWLMVAFDHKGKLWKVWEFQKEWSEDFKNGWAAINHGVRSTEFQSVQVLDVQNNRGTIWEVPGGFPNVNGSEVAHLYDINHLEALHR
jgi:hypothetical protein